MSQNAAHGNGVRLGLHHYLLAAANFARGHLATRRILDPARRIALSLWTPRRLAGHRIALGVDRLADVLPSAIGPILSYKGGGKTSVNTWIFTRRAEIARADAQQGCLLRLILRILAA